MTSGKITKYLSIVLIVVGVALAIVSVGNMFNVGSNYLLWAAIAIAAVGAALSQLV